MLLQSQLIRFSIKNNNIIANNGDNQLRKNI